MGIYSAKFALESAVKAEDLFQSPKDIGNDLDEIEKAIAGPDGLEAHRDEIEDAQSGVVEEPLEEAFEALYESEYNYNMIMHTIGIHELRAASMGRDLVLEAADKEGFFQKVKDWLKAMWAKVVKVFKAAIAKISSSVHKDKTFAEKNKSRILSGASKDWSAKGYKYKDNINFTSGAFTFDWNPKFQTALKSVKGGSSNFINNIDNEKEEILRQLAQGATTIKEAHEKTLNTFRGSAEPVELKDYYTGEKVYKILTSDNEKDAINETYKALKESYDKSLGNIEDMKKTIAGKVQKDAEEVKNTNLEFAVCEYYTRCIKFEKEVQTMVYSALIKVAAAKRSQARKLAIKFISLSDKPAKEDKTTSVGESSIFGNLRFV